jgi:uncharacterized protein
MKETITIYKLDENGRPIWHYAGRLIERTDHSVCIEAFFERDDVDLGFVVFARGDRFVEYFYSDRWYNVFAVYDGENGRRKGWYINVCRPAELGETAVHYQDLALDLWVEPDGRARLMDEEEYAALNLSVEDDAHCQAAVRQALALAAANRLPR